MKKSDIGTLPNFFDRYINIVEDIDIFEALETFSPDKIFSEIEKYNQLGDKIYAPGKWTIKDIIQHCIDTERIMAYRALAFARNDSNQLPGFDENEYAKNTTANDCSIEDLLAEYNLVRQSTILMFKKFSKTMFLRKGNANKSSISPLSLGFVIVGHPIHHHNVITERYFSILPA